MSEKRLTLKRPSSGKRKVVKGNSAVTHVNRELMKKNDELCEEVRALASENKNLQEVAKERQDLLIERGKEIERLKSANELLVKSSVKEEMDTVFKKDNPSEFKIDESSDVVVEGVRYRKFRKATWFERFVWGDCYYAPNRKKVE